MAIIRIANGGGNFNQAGTWVGGVIPGTADDIRGDSLSGPLTLVATVTVRSVDLSGYIRKLTIPSGVEFRLGGATPITSTFSSAFATSGGYDFQGSGSSQGRFVRTGSGHLAWSGYPNRTSPIGASASLPCFQNSTTFATTTTTNMYFKNLLINSEFCVNGTWSTFVDGNLLALSPTIRFGGTQPFIMNGTGSVVGNLALITNSGPATLIIDTSGTITTGQSPSWVGLILGAARTDPGTITFQHIAGTVTNGSGANPAFRIDANLSTTTAGPIILGLTAGTYWRCYTNLSVGSTTLRNLIFFTGACRFDLLSFFAANNQSSTTPRYNIRLVTLDAGTTVECNNLVMDSAYQTRTTEILQKMDFNYELSPTMSLVVNNSIDINGGTITPGSPTTKTVTVRSLSSGTPAVLTLNTYSQYISNARFVDIDCSLGNTLYGQGLTLSNTTNIQEYTLPPATGGGGGGSFTFVN